jgi:hypothetical protein
MQGGEFNIKALASNNWVDPPKRERKRLLNYTDHAQKGKVRLPQQSCSCHLPCLSCALRPHACAPPPPLQNAAPRGPKIPQLNDFQFFNMTRLTQLVRTPASLHACTFVPGSLQLAELLLLLLQYEKEHMFQLFTEQQKEKKRSLEGQVGCPWCLHLLRLCVLLHPAVL